MTVAIRPASFAHVVYRTHRFGPMLDWYTTVFGGQVVYRNSVVAFISYDAEHHRIALVDLGALKGASDDTVPRGRPGVDHVAYGFADVQQLLGKYVELKEKDVLPYWCIHHGITISLYYADPDGNQMEFQADCFNTVEEANRFMNGADFSLNPIGVEFEPEELLARMGEGEDHSRLLVREVNTPVSPIRGSMLD
jgi:catechol-2,3-dioxygenase